MAHNGSCPFCGQDHFFNGLCPGDTERKTPMKAAAQALLDVIDRSTEPSKMSKEEALDVLEDLIEQLSSRIEALRDEIAEEE